MLEINRTAFHSLGPNENRLRICLDFGTAMSKAWGSGYSDDDTIPLVLGRAAGEGNELAVPSSIFISRSGRIFFGRQAEIQETQHRQEAGIKRQRFDNLKSVLSESEIGQDLQRAKVSREIDPTQSLTIGDLLTLYLAWLTDLSLIELEQQIDITNESSSDGIRADNLRYVRRRFAIPCFENSHDEVASGGKRAQWAEMVMNKALLRAQIIADTLNGRWNEVTVREVSDLLRRVQNMDISKCNQLLASEAAVREPVAAGASRFEKAIKGDKARRILLVIDAGAGTTDFAVFQVFSSDEETRYALISSGVSMCRIAGNRVDQVLIKVILKECGVDLRQSDEEERRTVMRDLESDIRNIKQSLFREKRTRIDFRSNVKGEVRLDALLADDEYRKLGEELCMIRNKIIGDVFRKKPEDLDNIREHVRRLGRPFPVYVLLTGGSGAQPITKDLAKGRITIDELNIEFTEVEETPEWIKLLPRDQEELVTRTYPQCAVSIGGSACELPQERDDLDFMVSPAAPGARWLEGYFVKGK